MSHASDNGRVLAVHSMGGLGNQLFIAAAGLAQAKRQGCDLEIDVGLHGLTPNRPSQLPTILPNLTQVAGVTISYVEITPRLARGFPMRVPRDCSYLESEPSYDPNFSDVKPGECAFGYFQSWRYFDSVASEVRDALLTSLANLTGENESRKGREVVIHVRHGDYLSRRGRKIHGVLGSDYYSSAIQKIQESGVEGRPLILSEGTIPDIGRWKELLPDVAIAESGSVFSHLALMARSPVVITANSSFSWWGAHLAGPRALVAAPWPWFRSPTSNPRDLLPPSWIVVPHHFGEVQRL